VTKQFWTFLLIGLGVVAVGIFTLLSTTKGSHLVLTGEVLKVRVLALNPQASLVVADFRATNPSNIPFVVRTVEMWLDPPSGDPIESQSVSKADIDNVFKYEKLIGPKYNDVLSIKDEIAPHQTADRMTGGRFELPESSIAARKTLRLRIVDLDGATSELVEKH
jgi:hypothetical protein